MNNQFQDQERITDVLTTQKTATDGYNTFANEDSDTVIEFDFDSVTGQLTPTLNIVHTGSPVCLVFAD